MCVVFVVYCVALHGLRFNCLFVCTLANLVVCFVCELTCDGVWHVLCCVFVRVFECGCCSVSVCFCVFYSVMSYGVCHYPF